ncbi:RSP_2647 family RNA methyltransferase [Aestuariibius insulae]|uniref:RSP_2647 family RNA methyltransferase n=1 Tax=Aestuariibius insulae TaxID=2058287 RepID=UPI00345E5589
MDYPALRLKPKVDPRPLRRGFPWVYGSDLVMDRRAKGRVPGSLAVLEDGDRKPIGLVAVNPQSKITARLLDRDPEAVVDRVWLVARLERSLSLRRHLYDAPYYRLVHAEADGLPGVVIDRFGALCVVQPNAAWAEVLIEELAQAVMDVTGCATVLKNASGRARSLEGLDDVSGALIGETPTGPVPVPMNDATYLADLVGGQKTGIFYDQRPNHAFVAGLCDGARVLDVFSHVGGFALAALAAGAQEALAVDGSAPALELAAGGAKAMGVQDRFATRQGDAFEMLAALDKDGERFDVVICDPPAFAPAKPALDAGLRAYEKVARLAAPLVREGGYLCLCSCSHAVDLTAFRTASIRGVGRARRSSALIHTGFAGPDHPVHPQLAATGYLKALVFRL